MIDGFVRVAAVTPRVSVGNPAENAEHIEQAARNAARLGARIIVTPELSLTGYTCGELFLQDTLLGAAKEALARLVRGSAGRDEIVIVGLPFEFRGKLYNVAAVYSDGMLHGLVPKTCLPNYGEFYELRHFTPAPSGVEYASLDVSESGFERRDETGTEAAGADKRLFIIREPAGSPLYDEEGFDGDEDDAESGFEDIPFGANLIFRCIEEPDIAFAVEICEDLWAAKPPSVRHAKMGAVIIANLSASDETIGKMDYRRLLTRAQSGKLLCGYIYANAGAGESTTDMTFSGHSLIAENGVLLAESKPFSPKGVTISEIDVRGLLRDRRYMNTFGGTDEADEQGIPAVELYEEIFFSQLWDEESESDRSRGKVIPIGAPDLSKEHGPFGIAEAAGESGGDADGTKASRSRPPALYRFIDPRPFVPSDAAMRKERCEEIFEIQTAGLATRLTAARAKAAVIGVSGGLDSTLALLVAMRAAKAAGLPKSAVIAVTMPSFGTTERTKKNALGVSAALGVSVREIAVSDTVRAHLASIGHDESVRDTVYENAQARVRTLTLMDIANAADGLVVGTGDLSELALGWATYNGDHMSMYGVNAGVPKTLVRHIIGYVMDEADAAGNAELAEVLRDILDTPVSPELLPPEDGDISQKTEEIVGPYELHDFFLYHMVRFGRAPGIIYGLAKIAFADEYDAKTIIKWLLVFTKRFFANQFKRSALPDGPKVGSVTLSPRGDWRMPSDADADAWIREIESIAAGL